MNLPLLLKLLGVAFVLVGLGHVALGPGADMLLGANLSETSRLDPVLDSQNRFYGAAFTLYGVLLYYCSNDLARFLPILQIVFVVFFLSGVARLVSIAVVGWPSGLVMVLLVIEFVLPPVMYIVCNRHIERGHQS